MDSLKDRGRMQMDTKSNIIRMIIVSSMIIIAGVYYSYTRNSNQVEVEILLETQEVLVVEVETTMAEPEVILIIHVGGEVMSPGVYEVKQGQRVYEVIELAGGFTEAAAKDYLNLAEVLEDGMKLIVPNEEDLRLENIDLYGQVEFQVDSKVDLNKASKEQLMNLTGIGEAKAEDIITYREEIGLFQSIEEIMNISGIKEAAFEKIKDDIYVSGVK